ncbi:ATP-dependent sacrificial sulfur transferase LarE [Kribbella capetownensis]|uniref:ATP-dependent sacrificial sulfur transferase LarE n=1 Tax=Kribbella capetownensis TaxID=1572659 RepID=A0A4R0J482_9ACTN|nr:ATP-dependent sacrificial sulfur transferase LarE [Kribbella capetownensis]TCC39056.1 ATP-dependent sacrificial sulfur transferase LarE [Kribbella capetownensis]
MSTAEIQPAPATADVPELVVGFDLDMTLIDSRPGIQAVWDLLSAETGVPIDSDLVVSRLGPPLTIEMANWFPPEQIDAMVVRYREHYPSHAITGSLPLPGAAESLAAVRALRGRTMVVSAKYTPSVLLHMQHLGLDIDEPVGDLHGAEKGTALREHKATIYVGDHTADIEGARAAGAVAVAVATGPFTADELRAYGADVVLNDLTEFPAWLDAYVLEQRLEALMKRLSGYDKMVVAFSGGADSAFLLAAAARAIGPANVVAATAISPSLPAAELEPAARFADSLGVRHLTPHTHEMDREGYQANAGDRCYFCKAELVETLQPIADEFGMTAIATGTNADDAIAGFRPGIRAAFERGALTPLKDARLTKAQIREASRSWGLETSDKPAAACLSSRIAYGIRITPNLLARVDRAEQAVRSRLTPYGVQNVRVRDLGDAGSIEIDRDLLDRVDHEPLIAAVVAEGFPAARLDPRGFRSGSMNERLKNPEKYR